MTEDLAVLVIATNDNGETIKEYGFGETVDEAIGDALQAIEAYTDDDSFVMNDWSAA